MIVYSGIQGVRIENKDYYCKTGEVLVIFPGLVHELIGPAGKTTDADSLLISTECIPEIQNMLQKYSLENPLFTLSKSDFAAFKHSSMILRSNTAEFYGMKSKGAVYLIISYLLPYMILREKKDYSLSKNGLDTVRMLIEYMSNHFEEDISLNRLSSQLHISRTHLSHIFNQQLKTGLREYINTLRINEAQKLIKNSDLSITEICFRCGYNNQRTFNRVFKDISHVSPLEYRKKYLQRVVLEDENKSLLI